MKRVYLFIVFVALLLNITAYADYSEGYFYYTIDDYGVVITGYFGKEESVVIPDHIAGYPVYAVAPDAFAGTGVVSVTLPDTIVEFRDSNVAEIIWPEGMGIPTEEEKQALKEESGVSSETEPQDGIITVSPSRESEGASGTSSAAAESGNAQITVSEAQSQGSTTGYEAGTITDDGIEETDAGTEEETEGSAEAATDSEKTAADSEPSGSAVAADGAVAEDASGSGTVIIISVASAAVIVAAAIIIIRKKKQSAQQ